MNARTLCLMTGVLLCAAAHSALAQSTPLDSLARLFEYDRQIPLDVKDTLILDKGGVKVYDITYASPVQGRVSAYLIVPGGNGPHPAILFGHWGNGTYSEFLSEAISYGTAGVVSLLPAYPWVRPDPWRRNITYSDPTGDRNTYAQAVIDLRRGLDLLRARSDVDTSRLAYVGHSYGAQMGAILSAVDKRFVCGVLIGGAPSADEILQKSDDPDMAGLRAYLGPDRLKKYLDAVSVLDGINYVPYAAPIPLLFQFARFDRYFGTESMQRYFDAAKTEKQILWYNTGHEVNDPRALLDRAIFLGNKLHWTKIPQTITVH